MPRAYLVKHLTYSKLYFILIIFNSLNTNNMGKLEDGILGGFSGKVGTVVGARWRNQDILRTKPVFKKRRFSEAQKRNQARFATVTRFLNPLKGFLKETFAEPQGSRNRFDQAKSYYLKEVVALEGEAFVINYEKALISAGMLRGLRAPLLAKAETTMTISWEDNSGHGLAYGDDLLTVIAHIPKTPSFFFFEDVAQRGALHITLDLPKAAQGIPLVVWATFRTADHGMKALSSCLSTS